MSTGLYKVILINFWIYNVLVYSSLGGTIGSICCCATTCVDDIALASENPIDLQAIVSIAYDYSQREGYMQERNSTG